MLVDAGDDLEDVVDGPVEASGDAAVGPPGLEVAVLDQAQILDRFKKKFGFLCFIACKSTRFLFTSIHLKEKK